MKPWARNALYVLWPSFVVAGGAEFLFFSIFDPHELTYFGQPIEASRQAVYTIGFFGFWALGAASAALTSWLAREAT
ncbi:hypothetical protein BWI17_21795 [Betaproteobacteria bacterium GR16-43]|nr:hypothetical protein BWI17_21795 [Betaproteobacteria bacterium GR16-43]